MNPVVSILVTVYNREAYLEACLDSILASTFQDFEVVVVDDVSQDGSVRIAEDYAARDPRIRFYRNEKNQGDYPNRNRAAELATGRYLKYVDADDMIYGHSLQVMVEAMERFPDAALGLSWNVLDPPIPYPFQWSAVETHAAHFLGRSPLGVGPSAAIIRRDAFESVGGFSGRQFVGDTELWMKLTSRWPMVSLPPALVWWRRHEGQQMAMEEARPEILTARFHLQCSALKDGGVLSPEQTDAAGARLRQHYARRILALALRKRKPALAWRLFQQSGMGMGDLLRGLGRYE
jgi:glycosyltransferase involved in cell wall biosynthesis